MRERSPSVGRPSSFPMALPALRCGVWVALLALSSSVFAAQTTVAVEAGPELVDAEMFASVAPAVTFESESLSLELSAPLRVRLNRLLARDRGLLRREDWDHLDDLGRALRRAELSLGERTFTMTLGALAHRTLGHGTIVSDFGTVVLPDAMPLGIAARLAVGPVAVEALDSDLVGLEVTAASLSIEPFSLAGPPNDRLHVALSAAADWNTLAETARRFAVLGASLDLAAWRSTPLKLAPYVDFNSTSQGGHGLHVGLLADASLSLADLSARLEYRHTRGPYQPEYFDFAYSIERSHSAVATSPDVPKPNVVWGTDDSWRAEVRARSGPCSIAADIRSRGRDTLSGQRVHDASAVAEIQGRAVTVAAFVAARQFAWGHNPARVLALGEARYRVTPFLHLWVAAGRLYQPTSEGGTRALWHAGGGLGGALALFAERREAAGP